MRWQRGLLLAGINLVAALPLILVLEARDAEYLRVEEEKTAVAGGEATRDVAAPQKEAQEKPEAPQEEQTVSFDCMEAWIYYPIEVRVVKSGNLPAFVLTGWRLACDADWTLTGILEGEFARASKHANLTKRRKFEMERILQQKVDAAMYILIAIQWFLLGAFPPRQFKRWWAEPGAMITAFTLIAACFALIPAVKDAASLLVMLAMLAWVWWFGVALWVLLRFALRQAAQLLPARSN
jgi:hypothetical protein